jgi:hypothetical protein
MRSPIGFSFLFLTVICWSVASAARGDLVGDTTRTERSRLMSAGMREDPDTILSTGRDVAPGSGLFPWERFTWAGSPRATMDGAQPNLSTQIRPLPAAIVAGAYFGSLTWLHIYQERTIWAAGSSFRVVDDWDESLSANYGGHFTGGYVLSSLSTDMLITAGFSPNTAMIFGSLMGFAYQWYVEVLDGYGKDYGWSPGEVTFQSAGAVYYFCSCYSPFLQNFTPKADYYPAPWFGDKKKALAKTPIDDYSAWTFWMSANMHNLLYGQREGGWPSWLNLAAGYSARDLGYPARYRVLVFALDFNLAKIIPEGGPVWNWWRQAFGFLKIPGPALEFQINKETRFYLLYPFKINF